MKSKARDFDADHIESFHAVATAGSLNAASDRGNGSLSTLSRHISLLEHQIGDALFERRTDGMLLTATGTRLFELAQKLHKAKIEFALAAVGLEKTVKGTVKIAASTAVAASILPTVLAKLAVEEPELIIEVIVSGTSANLLMGEADIALRSYRPTQSNLVSKRIGEHKIGAFAAKSYLKREGTPATINDLNSHAVIGDNSSAEFYEGLAALGLSVTRESFRFRTDSRITAWSMMLAGCGIGFAPPSVAKASQELVRVLPNEINYVFPLWLVANPNLRTNLRTRRVFDFISAEFSSNRP